MSWGKGIVAAFVFFALFIGVLVTVCMRQQVSLVSKDYYAQELNYQQEIDQASNAAALAVKPSVKISGGAVEIKYGDLGHIESGSLKLYRPSDPGLDKSFEVVPSTDSVARFDVSGMMPGKYNVNFLWSMNGKSYLSQQVIVL